MSNHEHANALRHIADDLERDGCQECESLRARLLEVEGERDGLSVVMDALRIECHRAKIDAGHFLVALQAIAYAGVPQGTTSESAQLRAWALKTLNGEQL